MNEKTRFTGTLILSFSLLCLAAAIGYFGLELNKWRKTIPEILQLTEDATEKIGPAMENVTEIGKLIPPILEEVAETRTTVDNVVKEVATTRKQLPDILEDLEPITRQIENTVKELPDVVDPLLAEVDKTREMVPDILEQVKATNLEIAEVRELVPGILTEIQNTNVTVDKAVTEIRETREAMPGIMDRADQLVLSARDAGKEAGKGAVSGVIGGIIAAPFGVVGGIGSRITGFGESELGKVLTEKDLEILYETLLDLADNGNTGETVTWKNKKSSNSGKITLLNKYDKNDQECREIRIETFVKGEEPRMRTVKGCRQADGAWAEDVEDSGEGG